MREFYLRYKKATPKSVEPEHLKLLEETRNAIQARSHLIWAEHCSECAMPACFSYCEYYSPRMDLKCQRFTEGLAPVAIDNRELRDVFSVGFKKWGKLEAAGIATLQKPSGKLSVASTGVLLENMLRWSPVPYFMQRTAAKAYNKLQSIITRNGLSIGPDTSDVSFLIETINQHEEASITFTIREVNDPTRFFQKLITIPKGYRRSFIDFTEMANISPENECLFQIEPSLSGQKYDIIFGIIDFIRLKSGAEGLKKPDAVISSTGNNKVKCVIWDLDNTLWNGTLIEDGIEGIKLRPEMVSIITKLDSMGILNAVASKNNFDDAMEAIQHFGLKDYFLYPQISWNPKSASIQTIQKSLNIGMDTLVFVDDQVFERTEVNSSLPEVRVVSDKDIAEMMQLPEFNVPITAESRKRRKMYQEDQIRTEAFSSTATDYTDFLKSCNIQLRMEPLSSASMNRVHELSQRTNQMNFSGNRYTKTQLINICDDPNKKTFVISVSDKFGSYGIVGFAIVDEANATLIDLMFSCRIQAKQIEHTFFAYQFENYKKLDRKHFFANYKPTKKNAQSGKVFFDVGFKVLEETDGVQKLQYDLDQYVSEPPIMEVIYEELTDIASNDIQTNARSIGY
ncbi:MAG: HAD-IIIC family phosphatase [Methyloligellaceae bacterium]